MTEQFPNESRVEALCADQRQRWHQGVQPRVESYLEHLLWLHTEPEALLELIYNEIVLRSEMGDQPQLTEYVERFASLELQLRKLFEIHEAVEGDPLLVASRGLSSHATIVAFPDSTGEPSSSRAPDWLGSYELLQQIGRGGMGVVYKARHRDLNRIVAVKMILAGAQAGTDELARFRREAEAVARFQHVNIVQIYDVGEQNGCPYFSLEYVENGSLEKQLGGKPLPAMQAASLLQSLARAIHYAHERGIVHRDLKPANILLTAEGIPKITDFGLAKRIDVETGPSRSRVIVGTPAYMAPEQTGSGAAAIGPGTDVYALGAVLYELLTGRPPFQAATVLDTLVQVVSQEPVSPQRLQPKVPRDLETICLKCLQKEPRKRYASALVLAEDCERFLAGRPIRARPIPFWERGIKWAKRRPSVAALLALAFLLAALGFGGIFWQWRHAEGARQDAINLARAETIAKKEAQRAQTAEAEAHANEIKQGQRAVAALEKMETALYFNRTALALHMWTGNHVRRAEQLLDFCKPEQRGWEWHYVKRLCHTERQTFRHTYGLQGLVLSADGKRFVSADWGNRIHVWDIARAQEVRTIREHGKELRSVAINSEGTQVASANADGTIELWDLSNGRILFEFQGHSKEATGVAFSPDGKMLASASLDETVRVWDVFTARELFRMQGQAGSVHSVVFSPDGKRLASAHGQRTAIIWDLNTRAAVHTLGGPRSRALAVCFSPNGERLATAGWDAVARIWDATTGKEIQSFSEHTNGISSVAFSRDGRRLATASWDQTIKIWNLKGSQTSDLTLRGHTEPVTGVAFSPDGDWLVSASGDHTVKIWSATGNQTSRALEDQLAGITSIAFHPDGCHLAAADWANFITIRDLTDTKKQLLLAGHTGSVRGVAFSPDGRWLASGSQDKTMRVWDSVTGKELLRFEGHNQTVLGVAFSPDGKRLASVSGRAVMLWDATTGKLLFTCLHRGQAEGLAFSPDGRYLATGSGDDAHYGEVKLWDAGSGKEIVNLTGHTKRVLCVVFSPDGQYLASSGIDKTVRIWDRATGRQVFSLEGHSDWVHRVAYSPNGRRLASASTDRTVKVWDLATGEETITLSRQQTEVYAVAFSPDGNQIASGGRTIHIWDGTPLDKKP